MLPAFQDGYIKIKKQGAHVMFSFFRNFYLSDEEQDETETNEPILDAITEDIEGLTVSDSEEVTALIYSVMNGDLEAVKCLIDAGQDVLATNQNGDNALLVAIDNHQSAVAQFLIPIVKEKGALDHQNNRGWSAFMLAARRNELEVLKALESAGASVTLVDEDGDNALNLALAKSHHSREVLDYLIDLMKDKGLLEHQANDGATALMLAAYHGHSDSVKKLIEARVDLDRVDLNGDSALISAVKAWECEIAKTLIQAEPKLLSMVNYNSVTPLYVAKEGLKDKKMSSFLKNELHLQMLARVESLEKEVIELQSKVQLNKSDFLAPLESNYGTHIS